MNDTKSFSLTVIANKTFSLIVDGISEIFTFLFSSNETIKITSFLSAIERFQIEIDAGNINISSVVRLVTDLSQSINFSPINSIYEISERIKAIVPINLTTILLTTIRDISRTTVPLFLGSNVIASTLTLGQFFVLDDFDPDTLSSLDTGTLADMDFEVVV